MQSTIDSTEIPEEDEVQEREIAPGQARKVTQSFTEMSAWQKEMQRDPENATDSYYGSKRQFMENCKAIYPVEVLDVRQAGTEIVKAREIMEGLDQIENLSAELQKTARNIRLEEVSDPIELIREINRIIEPASRNIQLYNEKYPGTDFEAGSQLDRCFREIYRLEILRDALESTLTAEQKKDLAAGKEKTEEKTWESLTPQEKEAKLKNIEVSWLKLGENYPSIEEILERDTSPPHIDRTNFDEYRAEILDEGIQNIWEEYQRDERPEDVKKTEYKLKIGELLNSVK